MQDIKLVSIYQCACAFTQKKMRSLKQAENESEKELFFTATRRSCKPIDLRLLTCCV